MIRTSTLSPIKGFNFDLDELNSRFKKAEPKKILAWCVSNIPRGLVQISNFTIDDLVITDLLYRELQTTSRVPVIFVDTLHHFSETLEVVEIAQKIYDLELMVCKNFKVKSREEFSLKYGYALWERDIERFNYLTKIEPLHLGLEQLEITACIQGFLGRCTSDTGMNVFDVDQQGCLQINPLAHWSRTESWAYAYEHDLIYNALYDQGYSTIGDEPLTRK